MRAKHGIVLPFYTIAINIPYSYASRTSTRISGFVYIN